MTEIMENNINQVNAALDAIDAAVGIDAAVEAAVNQEPMAAGPIPLNYSQMQVRVRELEERLVTSNEIRTALVKEKSELELNLSNTQYGRTKAEDALAEFKDRVIEVAMDAAMEKDWCDEIEYLLRDGLGLELPERRAYTDVTVTIRVEATSGARPIFDRNDPDSNLDVTALGDGRFEIDGYGEHIEVVDVRIDGIDYGEWNLLD